MSGSTAGLPIRTSSPTALSQSRVSSWLMSAAIASVCCASVGPAGPHPDASAIRIPDAHRTKKRGMLFVVVFPHPIFGHDKSGRCPMSNGGTLFDIS